MDRIHFKVNSVEHSVGSELSADVTLLEYLRRWLELRGTKYMCLEAGCGACIVSVVKHPGGPVEGVNACMVLITSCHGWEITTIEKVGNKLQGYHPLQRCLYENNGSQCGHCSPGWVMAMYSLIKKNKKMTMLEIEKSLASNICRCTGYRPILEAFKKFASDAPDPYLIADIEDLSICSKTGETCSQTCEDYDWCVVNKEDVKHPILLHIKLSDNRDWYRVENIEDIFKIFTLHPSQTYMLIGGNTAKGVYPILEYPRVLIDISTVAELKGYYLQQNLVVGAGNTLTELDDIFLKMSQHEDFRYLTVLREHLKLIAHIPVKNIGTIAGNLMIKNRHNEFNSDIFLLLNTIGASVGILQKPGDVVRKRMKEFLNVDMNGKVLFNIFLPPLNDDLVKVVTFKVMPRSQNAHAIVHAGYLYELTHHNRVLTCRIAYGGLSAQFNRAYDTEKKLKGRQLFDNDTLQSALRVLSQEMVGEENLPDMPLEYRRKLALGLFYKGLLSLCPQDILAPRYRSGKIKIRDERSLSKGTQVFETDPSIWPLNKPSPKFDGLIQCAGEASYSEDLPSLPQEVFASFVLSTVALGTIEHIDAAEAMKEPGVIAFYTAADIPGTNSFTPAGSGFYIKDEELLCEKEIKYFNQALAIIVAKTQNIANKASLLVKVTYSNVREPVLDIKLAKRDPNRIKLFKSSKASKIGNDITKVIKGDMSIYWQYHFCLETLACVSHPIEEGIKLYATTQWIDGVQRMVERALNMKQNQIDVYLRRLGGTYGIKISRSIQVAVACALVTYKLNRPCRFIQSLRNNMRHVGKRMPASIDFEIAVNSEGVIQHNQYQLFEDNGYIVNETLSMLGFDLLNNCYDKVSWDIKLFDATTDMPSNTWCRSPGTLEAVSMAEWILERIAYEMNLDPLNVRLANVNKVTHGEIIELVNTLQNNSQYKERRKDVDKFNRENRWKKKGLRHSFLRWVPVGSIYLNVTVTVYVDDGSVVVTHGGVEMGQGINTKAAQVCAFSLDIPVENVQIKPNDTTITPNCFISGGSLASEFVCIGVVKCCREINKNLEPIRKKMPDATWEEIIRAAGEAEVNLTSHCTTGMSDKQEYTIYGVTLAEVEIDVLTGEWNIIRVDLIEDVGRSVNPEIDVGQVEGAFIMGCGYWTTEELILSPAGEMLTDRTWHYWVPQARDIPQDFRIYFRKKSFSNDYILGAKATGEPATCMGVVIPITIREAIVEARKESGLPSNKWFSIDGPYTVAKICLACATNIEDFKFY
ncbi:xanthine dehydrogenase-like [Pieris rapae]|uniref:xanthine dehydrogenase-like n=1 Tax=Pieris rapae TaxID=64459 RepID=UPI001E27BBF5|nr:xanthine dehydrogenase-like [Pieris rapae]XP_045484578.1 xanthine dehydrogenase-like [Pieris rapae]